MRTEINRIAFYGKQYLLHKAKFEYFAELNKNQYLPIEKLEELNWEKRKAIVSYAYNNCQFYRKFYDEAGVSPKTLRVPGDFEKLPPITKSIVKNNFENFIAQKVDAKYRRDSTTGGSTGVPLRVLHDTRVPIDVVSWRVLNWWNVEPSDNIVFIGRLVRTGHKSRINHLLWWPTRRGFLDASYMSAGSMGAFVKKYRDINPRIVQGYVGGVFAFAKYICDNNIKINSPQAVWATSAPLVESQRKYLENVFGAPVYDQYGSCEVFWLGSECKKQDGLHMLHDIRHIEFVDESGKGVEAGNLGDILVTDLENKVFPLIRYHLGDKGRRLKKRCSCGVGLPLMDKVRGRVSDVIKIPNGDIISGEYLTTLFDDFPEAVETFQVKQSKDYSLEIRCVPSKDASMFEEASKQVVERLKRTTGNSLKIDVIVVSEIKHDKGKVRFIASEVR